MSKSKRPVADRTPEAARLAVYSGTFDPPTRGHEDVIRRALQLFDRVLVAVALAHHKKTQFSLEQRIDMVRACVADAPQVQVLPFDGLIVDFCHQHGACALVRGLRNGSDFDYEAQMAAMNRKLLTSVETVFLLPQPDLQCISSTLVREVAHLGGDVSPFVHPRVAALLRSSHSAALH